jgi:hypothetical protein
VDRPLWCQRIWAGGACERGDIVGIVETLDDPHNGHGENALRCRVTLAAGTGSFDSMYLARCARHLTLRMTGFIVTGFIQGVCGILPLGSLHADSGDLQTWIRVVPLR